MCPDIFIGPVLAVPGSDKFWESALIVEGEDPPQVFLSSRSIYSYPKHLLISLAKLMKDSCTAEGEIFTFLDIIEQTAV